MKQLSLGALLLATSSLPALAQDSVTIDFVYPYSSLFDVTYEAIMPAFKAAHPNIDINIRASYEEYEDASNTILREAVSGNLPDVTMQGLNRQQILVDRGIAQSLEPFIAREADFQKDGYHEAMLSLSTFDGEVNGLPFSVSLPVGYYNMDTLAAAGVDTLPTTWDEVVETCQTLIDSGVENPIYWDWAITGNWFFQALMWTQGRAPVEDGRINMDSPEALKTLETVKHIVDGCNMRNLTGDEAVSAFAAGELPLMYTSTSNVGRMMTIKADFDFETGAYPGIDGTPDGLPAGGNAAVMTSTSEDPAVREAAWQWLKFITSGEGAAEVARTTGYMPPNRAANDIILVDFYEQNPQKATAVEQLPLLRDWQAYPGDNGLAITQVIYDGLERIVTGDAQDMEELQEELTEEIDDLLPRS